MGNAKFSDDFKRDAVHQIAVRGISSQRGFTAAGCQHTLALCVGEEVFEVRRSCSQR